MEQTTNNMALQIGNLIANALLANNSIYLPSIGSLYVDSISSSISSSGRVMTPPRRVIKFSDEKMGRSIVELLGEVGHCDEATSENIYTRWAEGAKTDNGVNIVGVGTVVNRRFNVVKQLDAALNPDIYRELKLKKRKNSWLWIAGSIVVCVVVGFAANYLVSDFLEGQPKSISKVSEVVAPEEITPPVVEEEVSVAEELEDEVVETEVADANPRYRVVYGVYSTMENANKAVGEIGRKPITVAVKVRPFGKLFMVNILESNSVADCKLFMEQNKEVFPELWISKRRGE